MKRFMVNFIQDVYFKRIFFPHNDHSKSTLIHFKGRTLILCCWLLSCSLRFLLRMLWGLRPRLLVTVRCVCTTILSCFYGRINITQKVNIDFCALILQKIYISRYFEIHIWYLLMLFAQLRDNLTIGWL